MKTIFVFALVFLMFGPCYGADRPDIALRGELSGADNHTYRPVPFDVPEGVVRITVEFSYTGQSERTTIDLGLLGPDGFETPNGFKGWSGGNKSVFTVSTVDSTPSYRTGPIVPGKWKLLLGIPNIRSDVKSEYTAKIYFSLTTSPSDEPEVLRPVIRSGPGWYRGDLHMHTGHSDGYARSQTGKRVPSPLFLTANFAADRGLDFVVITDHNTDTHANDIRELQPYFDQLLLVPGYEVTTFQGHANVIGITQLVDFRVGSPGVPDWNAVLRQAAVYRGFVSINHPIRPSGEICMGCGWMPEPAADLRLVQGVEIVNGPDADTPFSGIPFWQQQLNAGYILTGIGGSDNHNMQPPLFAEAEKIRVGSPTTVVYARELSTAAILEALRSGHVFVDVVGSKDGLLEFEASHDGATFAMGDHLRVGNGDKITFRARVAHFPSGTVEVLEDGDRMSFLGDPKIVTEDQPFHFDWQSDGKPHWLRVNVRGSNGKLAFVGNPIYINR